MSCYEDRSMHIDKCNKYINNTRWSYFVTVSWVEDWQSRHSSQQTTIWPNPHIPAIAMAPSPPLPSLRQIRQIPEDSGELSNCRPAALWGCICSSVDLQPAAKVSNWTLLYHLSPVQLLGPPWCGEVNLTLLGLFMFFNLITDFPSLLWRINS